MSGGEDSIWFRMSPRARRRLVWALWFVTWVGVLAGFFDRTYWGWVVAFSAAHAVLVIALLRFRAGAFPAQVRVLYTLWVAIGTYVPHAEALMWITSLGLPANLFFGYCPMARMVYLLPWNREERLSPRLLARIILTPPVAGRFKPTTREA